MARLTGLPLRTIANQAQMVRTENLMLKVRGTAHAWHMHGTCMAYAWHVHGICIAYAWHMHGTCMAHAWFLHGTCMAYAWLAALVLAEQQAATKGHSGVQVTTHHA